MPIGSLSLLNSFRNLGESASRTRQHKGHALAKWKAMAPDPSIGYLWGTPFSPLPHIERAVGYILNVKGMGDTDASHLRVPPYAALGLHLPDVSPCQPRAGTIGALTGR